MAQLQFRNQTRGFYGSMRVDDTTGDVTPLRDFISRSYQDGSPTHAQHQENCAILSDRLSVFYKTLRGRLPAGLPSLHALRARIDLLTPETVSALVASGPWDTYRPGGPEVDLGLGIDPNIGWSDLVGFADSPISPSQYAKSTGSRDSARHHANGRGHPPACGAAAYLGGAWRRMASVSVVRNALASRLRT
jgi:hypothetical protein